MSSEEDDRNDDRQEQWYISEAVGCYCSHSRVQTKVIWEIQADSTTKIVQLQGRINVHIRIYIYT